MYTKRHIEEMKRYSVYRNTTKRNHRPYLYSRPRPLTVFNEALVRFSILRNIFIQAVGKKHLSKSVY